MGRFLKRFIQGMGAAMDLSGSSIRANHPTRFIRLGSPADDADAIRGDFEMVGNDLRKAMLSIDVEKQAPTHSRVETFR